MWSNKNKEKNETKTIERRYVNQTSQSSQSLSVRSTYEERRVSTGTLPHFTTNSALGSSSTYGGSYQPPLSSVSSVQQPSYKLDAKPINLNYQSPYRTSPVYKSFSVPKTLSVPMPIRTLPQSYHPMLPAVVKNLPFETPGKIIVKKTGRFYDRNATIPTYETHSKNRGEVLIINNILFKEKNERHGAKKDDENLKILFEQMGFKVNVVRDLKKSGMINKMKDFSKKKSLKSVDISIVIIMSHGTKNTTYGGTEVFGLDDEGVITDELIECFNETDCKSMANKPKIFIFQCCRGDNEQFVQSDAQRTPQKKSALINALIAYSTLPGFVSHRDTNSGTWYIQTLCSVFSQHAHEYHIEDLLKMVDVKINSDYKDVKQTTHYENRGFKRCYLHPI